MRFVEGVWRKVIARHVTTSEQEHATKSQMHRHSSQSRAG